MNIIKEKAPYLLESCANLNQEKCESFTPDDKRLHNLLRTPNCWDQ